MTEFATQSIQDVAAAHGRPESSRFCLLDMQDQTTELVHPELSRVLQARWICGLLHEISGPTCRSQFEAHNICGAKIPEFCEGAMPEPEGGRNEGAEA